MSSVSVFLLNIRQICIKICLIISNFRNIYDGFGHFAVHFLVFNGIVHKIYRPKTSKENPENESTEGQNSQGFNEHSANADQNHDYEVIEDPERRIQLSKSLGTK